MITKPDNRENRPSGGVIFGWFCLFLCGALAFLSAMLATDVGFRVLFLTCGSALVIGGIAGVVRWYRQRR